LNTELYAEADHIGNFYLGGSFSEDVFFGNQTFSAGEFNQDVYLAKYDASSNLLWARHGQGIGSDQVVSLGVDDNNNVYMTGHFLDTLHFEGITIPYTLCCGSREVYIINYTHDGRPWWGEQVSGARTSLHSMTMNTANQLMMSGHFTEDLVIGQWTLSSLDGFVNFVTCLTGDIYTGIYQPAPTISFNSYPNPAKDVIFFDSQEKIMRIEVFNIQGTSCLTEESENVKQLRLEDLVPGTYFLRFTTANGETGIGKIVVVD
jgi:hypothetical protein